MGDQRVRTLIGIAVIVLAGARGAAAQAPNESSLSALLTELILRDITLPTPQAAGLSHSAHFSPFTAGELTNPAVSIVEGFNKQLLVQLSTFPIGSSAGGFSYQFDPALGTFKRASTSFGPLFAERAQTIGRGRLSGGFNYQHTRYDTFEGVNLDDGSIKFYLRHQECCTTGGNPVPPFFGVVEQPDGTRLNPFFEGDVIQAALSLNVTTDTFALFANYGLTDRWDVGLAVPFVRVDLEASVLATIERLATGTNTNIHSFAGGNPNETIVNRNGDATGLGDIALRTKLRVFDLPAGGIAAGAEYRAPTGNEQDLLGAASQFKLLFIESSGTSRFTHHINLGYTFSGNLDLETSPLISDEFPDEFNYAVGVEFVAEPRVTIVGDIVGRTLRDAGRLDLVPKTFTFVTQGATSPSTMAFDEFEARAGNLNLVFGTVGVKVNPKGNMLFSASVLFPLTDAGLKSRITTVFGMDYAF